MQENNVITEPQETEDTALTPETENQTGAGEEGVAISVKFNKEIKNLTAAEAATLAQKGMKFQMIEDDFLKLKSIAGKHNKSVPEYISDLERQESEQRREELLSECGGNEALADRVLQLENDKAPDDGLSELREFFPTVKSLDDLPRAVVESARLKGENLLNSYLKYRLIKRRRQSEEHLFERDMSKASIGSQKGANTPADDDFIKALWGR